MNGLEIPANIVLRECLMLIDTDILIWAMRGRAEAIEYLTTNKDKSLSIVTYMEILQGVRNKREQSIFEHYCETENYHLLPVNEAISLSAVALVKQYGLSHHMQMADALIAATATHHNLPLLSANQKHYRFIDNLILLPFILHY